MKGDKHIFILGAGESGVGSAILAKKQGLQAFVSDRGQIKAHFIDELENHGIPYESGQHSEEKLLASDIIVKSPGIPDDIEILVQARDQNMQIVSEIEFASEFCKGRTIGITGSNGKSTTTALTYHILKKAGFNVALGGNIGKSFARLVAQGQHDWYVLELSSFQLDGIKDFRPDLAVLLNITPDHLDRYHNSFEEYIQSKFRIVMNQVNTDQFIFNTDDKAITNYLKEHELIANPIPFSIKKKLDNGAWLEGENIIINLNKNEFMMSINDLALTGKHNVYNSMAAGIIARAIEIKKDIVRESLTDFKNLEHRLEFVGKVQGIEFINDSKATNVNSTWYALESMNKPVVWIAGGVDKGNDYSCLTDAVCKKVKAIVCIGVDNRRIHEAFGKCVDIIANTVNMKDAVQMSKRLADQQDVVLLSPACASFDLFDNYEDRGNQFKEAIRKL